MSLITCCPACQTMFQVSGEDLRVSDGWVRCGKCNGVFDASAHLQVMPPQPEESSELFSAGEPEAERPEPAISMAPSLQSPTLPPSQPTAFPVAERPSLFRAATRGDGRVSDAAFTGASTPVDPVNDAADADVYAPVTLDRADSPATLRREDRSAPPSFTQEPVSFTGHQPARSRKRYVLWLLTSVVLGVAVLGWARQERQALVQRLPVLLPAFDELCKFSACEVKAPRRLEVIAIEDASMQVVGPSDYKIQLSLKNLGDGAVELPPLKVTLTGLQGEVVADHIALPSQFAPGVTRLAPGAPLSVVFTFSASASPVVSPADPASTAPAIALAASAADAAAVASVPGEAVPAPPVLPISGYRVIAFYP